MPLSAFPLTSSAVSDKKAAATVTQDTIPAGVERACAPLPDNAKDTTMPQCHCGSTKDFKECCGPILSGEKLALTAEALMRARYTAFVEQEMDFLRESLAPDKRDDYDEKSVKKWAATAEWMGLEVNDVVKGSENDEFGEVEFTAKFRYNTKPQAHHERAEFKKTDGIWYYEDGYTPRQETIRKEKKVGRNEPCPCGSGKKYKKCCG